MIVVQDYNEDEGYWATIEVRRCPECCALVPNYFKDEHLDWHRLNDHEVPT